MRILFATPEAVPYYKTGGLGDVARALPDALAERGHDVCIIMPRYRGVARAFPDLPNAGTARLAWPREDQPVAYHEHRPEHGAPAIFVQHDAFDLDEPYGWPDDDPAAPGRRFALFCRAVLDVARDRDADVVHLNDWQTGLVPVYALHDDVRVPTVFAVHNLAYQGNFPPALLEEVGVPPELFRTEDGVEFYGHASFMKGGLAMAHRIVTVSPTYAREIQTLPYGAGFDGLLRSRSGALDGILNGVDTRRWDPATDPRIAARYDAGAPEAREVCRAALIHELGFQDDRPLAVMITRLAHQKGIDLVTEAMDELLGAGLRLAILGDGGPEYQTALGRAAARRPDALRTFFTFDDALARRLYAGADLFLMPSLYEPCGLGQMIAQRYGAVPVVRRTGGLADTVEDGVTGFDFVKPSVPALVGAVRRAVKAWNGPGRAGLVKRCMSLDRSWNAAAEAYEAVYRAAMGSEGARG